jgi:hypothetical protein
MQEDMLIQRAGMLRVHNLLGDIVYVFGEKRKSKDKDDSRDVSPITTV